ncbi:MAG: hypothetical protein EPO35_11635 [Acidobacteria bacterium]|nr:MAG: hypothetical protein EPO35_11635 [Acidobacteriota bacterium]
MIDVLRRRSLWGVVFVAQLSAVCASAQVPPKPGPSITFGALSRETAQVQSSDQLRELLIRWTATTTPARGGLQGVPAERLLVLQEQPGIGVLRRERSPQITEDQLVVVQRSADGAALDWRLVKNPRIVRAEVPGPDGKLTGRIVERESAEMLITLPDLPAATRLSVYQPHWNGTEYLLDLVGEVPLKRIR